MNRTARFVLKIIAASLGLAAIVCLIVGCWGGIAEKCCCVKKRLSRRDPEYDDYDDEELYEG